MLQTLGRLVSAKTTLPPGIPGPPCAYLLLQVPLFRSTTRRPLALLKRLAVRIVWWGEDISDPQRSDFGILLHPRIAGHQKASQIHGYHTRYPICVPLRKMQNYLEDMGTLFLDVIDEKTGAIMGRAKIENLARLTLKNPIKSVVAVANIKGVKIGELTVSMSLELIQATNSTKPLTKNIVLPTFMGDSTEQHEVESPDYDCKYTEMPLEEMVSKALILDRPKTTARKYEEPERDESFQKKSVKEDVGSYLSMEVLSRIQSALERSQRIRRHFFSAINTEQETAIDNNGSPVNQPKLIGTEILLPNREHIQSVPDLATQTAVDVENAKPIPYLSESYPCLLDSIDSQNLLDNNGFISNAEVDEDLEKDLIIETALLPQIKEVPQVEEKTNGSAKVPGHLSGGKALLEQPHKEHKPPANHLIDTQPYFPSNAPAGIRLDFCRLTFPMQIWNALGVLLSAFTSQSEGKNSLFHEDEQEEKSLKLLQDSGLGVSMHSKSNRNKAAIQNRSLNASPNKNFLDISKPKPPDLYLEILVPSFLVNKGQSMDSSIWCKRINLCHRLSKNTPADQNSNQMSEDLEVFVVPERNSFSDQIVISVNSLEDSQNALIHLNLFSRPLSLNGTTMAIHIGSIEINPRSLICAMYQSPDSSLLTSSTPSSKTLRIRLDFADLVKYRLMELLDVEYFETSLKKSFGFINVEPVLSAPFESIKTDGVQINQSLVQNEYQIHTVHHQSVILLNIREGRDLCLPSGGFQNSFLVVRIPWCTKEVLDGDRVSRKTKPFLSAVSWGTGPSPTYHFGLKVSATLSEDQITRLSKSFIAIEVWVRHMNSDAEKDELIGLAKIMTTRTSTLYRLISSRNEYKNSRLPFLQEDSWLDVISPSTGQVCGQLRSRFAAGTPEQISALMAADCENAAVGCFDWRSIDFITWKEPSSLGKSEDNEFSEDLLTLTVTHTLNIMAVKLIDLHPEFSEISHINFGPNALLSSDCDCFLQYRIPVDELNQSSVFRSPICQLMSPSTHKGTLETVHPIDCVELEGGIKERADEEVLNGYEVKWQDGENKGWHESHKYVFTRELVREQDITKNIKEVGNNAFLDYLRKDRFSQEDGIVFELWVRIYSPKLRDVCVAQGTLTWNILERHLLPPSSLYDVNKIANFPPNWKRELSQYTMDLYGINTHKLLGRILLNIRYEMISAVKYSVDLSREIVGKEKLYKLLPLTIRPGVRLNVHLHNLTGLEGSTSHQIRLHCLLLLPSKTPHSQYRVLTSSTLKPENIKEFSMGLDVLLPLAWNYESFFKERCGTKLLAAEEFTKFSLAEALAFGATEINDRQSWLVGNVTRPCLVIQVDVWDIGSNLDENHKENQNFTRNRFWGIDYGTVCSLELRPPERCGLIATYRFPLSDLLNSGKIVPRWISLLQVSSTSKSPGLQFSESCHFKLPYRLAGAFKISANFEANSSQRNLLEDIVSVASHIDIQSSRLPGFSPDSHWSTSSILRSMSTFHSSNGFRELSLHFELLRLPTQSALLKASESATPNERSLYCYFFIQAILGPDTSISSTHSLPQTANGNGYGIVKFQDTLTFKNVLVSDFKASVLEIQVWLSSNNLNDTLIKFANPTSRLLGFLQIPLSHLFRNQPPSDSEEVFYWCSRPNAAPLNNVSNCICIPVYPLVQLPSSTLASGCWIAFRAEPSLTKTEIGIDENISEEGALVWYVEDHLRTSSSKILRSIFYNTETFPAYVVIERGNRLSLDSSLKDTATLETFATFVVANENSSTRNFQRTVTTPPALDRLEPVWNYCRYALLPYSFINGDSKALTLDVWQRAQDNQQMSHLGRAKVPLSTLSLPKSSSKSSPVGLEFVRGWYEIYDEHENSKGQILVGVYPLGDKEEDPTSGCLCSRLKNLLNSNKAIETEANHAAYCSTGEKEVSVFHQLPFIGNSFPLIFENPPTNSPVSWELDPELQATNTSFLLNSLQSKLEELDIQNARFKEKLSHLKNSGPKDTFGMTNLPVEDQDNSKVEDYRLSKPLSVFSHEESEDYIIYPFKVTDNYSRTLISSPEPSCTYQPSAFEGDFQKINIDYSDGINIKINDLEENSVAEEQMENDDEVSLASTATLSSVSSLLLRNHFSEIDPEEVLTPQNAGFDCPSTFSVSSTNVEKYIQHFRQALKEMKVGPSHQEFCQSNSFISKDKVIADISKSNTDEMAAKRFIAGDKKTEVSYDLESKSEFQQTNIPWQPSIANSKQDQVSTDLLDSLKEPWNTLDSQRFQKFFQHINEDPNYQEVDEDIV
nr:C2 domain containing protein 3 [Hymenolepis microstoma]